MNLNYIIKKCKGFGYAAKLSDIKLKQIGFHSPNIVYMRDKETHGKPKGALIVDDFDDYLSQVNALDPTSEQLTKPTVFLVELGVPTKTISHKDIDVSDIEAEEQIDRFNIDLDIDDEKKTVYKNALKAIRRTPETYLNSEFNATYLKFMVDIFPQIKETKFQRSVLKILVKNQIRVDELLAEHPLNYEDVEVETTRQSSLFADLKVSDPFFEKSKTELEDDNTNGVLREFTAQAITKFNGFGNKFAQVDNSKKGANLEDISVLRNHANIHALARNKIIATPKVLKDCCMSKLMQILSRFQNFAIVFIWPNFHNIFTFADNPSKTLEVDTSEGNVILTVIFRYMLIHFYGLHSTISHTDYHQKYML